MNRLLKTQIRRHLGDSYAELEACGGEKFRAFINAIDASYEFNNKEQALLERTLELNSLELNQANQRLLKQNKDISRMATTDTLTGLPNRRACQDRVESALNRSLSEGGLFSLLFIDLDRFKTINDTMGHQAGDGLLKAVAQRLKACVRSSDVVSRLSGDEFTILLEPVPGPEAVNRVAQKIIAALADPVELDGRQLNVTASIGIGIYPTDGDNIVDIFKHADTAMYHVKANGRNSYQSYNPDMHKKALEAIEIESSLISSNIDDEFSIHYQPKLDLYTGHIVGSEALLRWNSPRHGSVPPDVFIPIAESTGYIIGLGEWVLSRACAQNKQWHQQGLRPVHVAVNISGLQLQHPDFLPMIERVLSENDLSPDYLELEITESMLMGQEQLVLSNLDKLKNLGIRLSIDDFGTGYSSLSKLKQFPIDSLKIDRSFVRDIANDPDDRAIVTAIIAMAKSLNLNVIAEGVESTDQLQCLIDKNCNHIQGYWFSKPLPATEFEQLLASDPKVPCPAAQMAG